MWRKKASVRLSGRRIDKERNTTIASGNLWRSGTEEGDDQTATVFRSKGDVLYLFRGKPRAICRASWINKENELIQFPPAISSGINHKSRGPHRRRSSEPNLMHCSNNQVIASTFSCDDCRRKRSNYARCAIFNSTNNLTSRPEPIFVLVSSPAVCHRVNGPSVSLSVPAIDNYHLCQNKNRINQCRLTRSTGNSPSLSVRSVTKNLGQKFWPKYHSMAHREDFCRKTHRPVSQPSAWRNSAAYKEGFNSLSCPLISP